MFFKVKKICRFASFLTLSLSVWFNFTFVGAITSSSPNPVDYKRFFEIEEPITLGQSHTHLFFPTEVDAIIRDFFEEKRINTDLFKKRQKRICSAFTDGAFDVKKCALPTDESVIAFFPPDAHEILQRFVFKTMFDGNGQANLKRVIYAQAINKYLNLFGIDDIVAPRKYLITLPGSDKTHHNDANYKVLSEKISIQERGNVFDLITPTQLDNIIKNLVIFFGMCDLHVDGAPDKRNVVYDTKGRIVFLDTEPILDRIIIGETMSNFENFYFFEEKAVIPEEFFIAQALLEHPHGSDAYWLGKTLCRLIYILNLGLIYPYRYYNFDTAFPPLQQDTIKYLSSSTSPKGKLQQSKFTSLLEKPQTVHAYYREHRRVIKQGMYIVLSNIIEYTSEIEKKYPRIRQMAIGKLDSGDFGPASGGFRTYITDPEAKSAPIDFIVVPIKEYLEQATQRFAGPRYINRIKKDGSIVEEEILVSFLPGVDYSLLEHEYKDAASPVPSETTSKTTEGSTPSPFKDDKSPEHEISPAPSTGAAPSEPDRGFLPQLAKPKREAGFITPRTIPKKLTPATNKKHVTLPSL